MKDDFYLFLSSTESSAAYRNNTFTDFIVECPKLYELEANHDSYWQVALTDLIVFGVDSVSADTKVVCILCDLVTQSHITATQKPVLRILPKKSLVKSSLYLPYYFPLAKSTFRTIRIQLCDQDLSPLSAKSKEREEGSIFLTLHFQLVSKV